MNETPKTFEDLYREYNEGYPVGRLSFDQFVKVLKHRVTSADMMNDEVAETLRMGRFGWSVAQYKGKERLKMAAKLMAALPEFGRTRKGSLRRYEEYKYLPIYGKEQAEKVMDPGILEKEVMLLLDVGEAYLDE